MSTAPTDREKARLQNTGMLNNVAGVLLAGMFSYLVFVLDKREPGGVFWLLVVAGAVLLVASFMFSGWGIEKIDDDTHSHFNRQAWAVLLGFVLLAASLIFLGPQAAEKSAAQFDALVSEVDKLQAQVAALEKTVEVERRRQDADIAAIGRMQGEIAELQKRCPCRTARADHVKTATGK